MGRELVIIWAGRHRRDRFDESIKDYQRRIRGHVPITDRWIKSRRSGDDERRKKDEGEALLAALPATSWVVAMDGGGRALTSRGFSDHLESLQERWPHAVVFALGSDLGLDPLVLERANEVLSLGPMTLAHELARLVLYEQIYRAMAIRSSINYHR